MTSWRTFKIRMALGDPELSQTLRTALWQVKRDEHEVQGACNAVLSGIFQRI